jgi:hypothetical protein
VNAVQLTPQELAVLQKIGRKFGPAGGKAAAANMTKAERIERARKAGSAPKKKRRASPPGEAA